jgi:3-hydroxyisobutyrate dehydrogenase-like beta-hydroxyacid dehydrogenase
MGAGMAATIARAGFDVVLWNRTRSVAAEVASKIGAAVADSAAAAAERAEFVITSLADDAAVLSVYLEADGIIHGVRSGSIVLEMSTISPETVHRVGASVDSSGAGFLDCPVSGSIATVEAGALTIMVGGDPAHLEGASLVLDALASRVVHVGDRGAGASTKLAVNGLVHGLNVALSEAVVLAERAGVDRAAAYDVFASGAGGAPFVHYKRAAYENPDSTEVAFSLDLVAKDLELIVDLGRSVGAPMRQAETDLSIVNDAIDAGYGSHDLSAIAVFLRQGRA